MNKKKAYIAPGIEITRVDAALPLAVSGITSGGDVEIGNGGVDEDGSLDPSAKGDGFPDIW
jgi:hypothetical protein